MTNETKIILLVILNKSILNQKEKVALTNDMELKRIYQEELQELELAKSELINLK